MHAPSRRLCSPLHRFQAAAKQRGTQEGILIWWQRCPDQWAMHAQKVSEGVSMLHAVSQRPDDIALGVDNHGRCLPCPERIQAVLFSTDTDMHLQVTPWGMHHSHLSGTRDMQSR